MGRSFERRWSIPLCPGRPTGYTVSEAVPTRGSGQKLNNGISESNNGAIGRIRTAARGFHGPQAFIIMSCSTAPGSPPTSPGTKHP